MTYWNLPFTLVISLLESPDRLKRKKGRFHWLLQSGLTYHANDDVRFFTLTSSNDSPEMRDMPYSLKRLLFEVRKLTPNKLVELGYLKSTQLKNYYPHRNRDKRLIFECAYCRTSEGNGVIHGAQVGDYLPHDWLSDTWLKKHSAWNVDIRLIDNSDWIKKYMMKQYLVSGQDGFIRGDATRGWLFPGARKQFMTLLKVFKTAPNDDVGYHTAIRVWNGILGGSISFRELFPDGVPVLDSPYKKHTRRWSQQRAIKKLIDERLGYNRVEDDLT